MPSLSDIRGQPRAIAALRRAIATGRVPHAYLFSGPEHSGKYTAALAVAAALNCVRTPGEGCADCEACAKIADGIHPDVITLRAEGAAQIIPIDAIRSEVVARVALPPHEGRARLFVVEEAAAMQGPAANALLKTLEEPPARTHFILITTAPDQLLPTIRSRCQRIAFAALPPDVRADLAIDGEDDGRRQQLADRLWSAVASADAEAADRAAGEATEDKTDTIPVLHRVAERLHERARAAAMAGDLATAAAHADGARAALAAARAVDRHNAHALLAVEALVRRLRRAGIGSAPRTG